MYTTLTDKTETHYSNEGQIWPHIMAKGRGLFCAHRILVCQDVMILKLTSNCYTWSLYKCLQEVVFVALRMQRRAFNTSISSSSLYMLSN